MSISYRSTIFSIFAHWNDVYLVIQRECRRLIQVSIIAETPNLPNTIIPFIHLLIWLHQQMLFLDCQSKWFVSICRWINTPPTIRWAAHLLGQFLLFRTFVNLNFMTAIMVKLALISIFIFLQMLFNDHEVIFLVFFEQSQTFQVLLLLIQINITGARAN